MKTNKYKKYIPIVDKTTVVIASIESFVVLPQVWQIFRDQNATGVSLFSWTAFWLFNFVWLAYGIVHRDKVIIYYGITYGFVQFWVIVGGLMYGAKWF